ncbi:hypothetical protein [Citrobacter amalonaticus]|uniref:hypothetical protein n=1 Tax=Citrobacter amalonaticus TaxID=35703 RepID=UPI0028DA805D|nr:hypothetical protein [Citrobacter amalonaticus]
MKRFLLVTGIVALYGCADNRPMPTLETQDVVCSTESECSYLWSKVPQHIETATRMRVENANDAFVITYPPIDTRQLGGRVSIVKNDNGSSTIKPEFMCHRHMSYNDCQRFVINATNYFNKAMEIEKKYKSKS